MVSKTKEISKGASGEEENAKGFDLSVVWLPFSNLAKLDTVYPLSNKNERTIPVLTVCIYNVEQLATAIAKHLKSGTNDSSDSDNESH